MLGNMPDGDTVYEALKANGVSHAVTVPDWVQIGLHNAIANDAKETVKMVAVCTEDEAITAAGGLYIGGQKPVIIIQNQGLYAGLNALRAVGLDAELPMVLFVGQFGREINNYDKQPSESSRRVVRILEPILDAVEIPYWRIESEDDLGVIDEAFSTAYEQGGPAVIIFGRNIPLKS